MMKHLAIAAALCWASAAAQAQQLSDALNAFAAPLAEPAPVDGACDLAPLILATRGAKVVGLGEPTHGTAEVFRLKHCAVQQLVKHGGAQHLVLEMSVGEGADLDDYVQGRRDDLNAILQGLPLWMFQTEEFADLLRWLRTHNASGAKPVSVHGMEAQYADRSARHALAYLRGQNPALADSLLQAFGPERVASDTASAPAFAHLYSPMSSATLSAYQGLYLGLRTAFDGNRDALIAATGENAFHRARRHVTALGQFTSLALLEDHRAQAQLRDYAMATNVADIVSRSSDGERVIVWAHNEHVWKQAGNGGYDVLGRQLARWYGPDYYAVGFDFGSGAYRAPAPDGWVHDVGPPAADSFTAALAGAGRPNLFLDIRGARQTAEGAKVLEGEFTVRASAGGYVPMRDGKRVFDQAITLGDRYDGLFFVARSTPPTASTAPTPAAPPSPATPATPAMP